MSCKGDRKQAARDRMARVSASLRAYRLAAKLTQRDVARMTGLTQQHVGDTERCRLEPLLGSVCLIADCLGVTLADLDDATREAPPAPPFRQRSKFTSRRDACPALVGARVLDRAGAD